MDLLRVFLKDAADEEFLISDQFSCIIIIFNITVIVIKKVLNHYTASKQKNNCLVLL